MLIQASIDAKHISFLIVLESYARFSGDQ